MWAGDLGARDQAKEAGCVRGCSRIRPKILNSFIIFSHPILHVFDIIRVNCLCLQRLKLLEKPGPSLKDLSRL